MELYVAGCHGGETPKHRTSAFVLDGVLAIDAGSLTSALTLREQFALEAVAVSHAHFDHVRDLATIADNRCQAGCGPLLVAATGATIDALKRHFFNDVLWPDFTRIPTVHRPTIAWVELTHERPAKLAGFEVSCVSVSHTIDAAAIVVRGPKGSVVYSGDTGPTDRLWAVANGLDDLRAVVVEVSFPNEQQTLATASGHHTPRTLELDVRKLRAPKDVPTLLFHIKPYFQSVVERECSRLRGLNLTVLRLGERVRLAR